MKKSTLTSMVAIFIAAMFSIFTGGLNAETKTTPAKTTPAKQKMLLPESKKEKEVVVPEGDKIIIDKSSMRLLYYQGDKVVVDSVIGCGVDEKGLQTPSGSFQVGDKWGERYMSKKYKSLMYYAIPFTNDGCCIHGSDGFVAMLDGEGNPLGFAQSHGCVRVPMSVAKELYQKVRVGTPVQVVGETEEAHKALFSIIKDMYEDTDSGIRMKVAGPNPSPADVQKAREMWLAGRLFSTPRGETDVRKRWVGYPFLPKESRMNAFDFEKAILTAEEKAQGKHLTFRKFDLVK